MTARSLALLLLATLTMIRAPAASPRRPPVRASGGSGSVDTAADRLSARISKALTASNVAGQRLDVAVTVRGSAGSNVSGLTQVIERSLLARLRRDRPHASVATLEEPSVTAATVRGFERWVDIKLIIKGTQVVFICQVHITADDVWHSVLGRSEVGGVVSAFQSSIALTPEIRTFLGTGSDTRVPTKAAVHPLRFRPMRIAFDPGSPVLAMHGADIDLDGVVELLVLTEEELLVARIDGQTVLIEQRFALQGRTPLPHPRHHVGTLVVTAGNRPEVVAQTSTHRKRLRVRLGHKTLRATHLPRPSSNMAAANYATCVFVDTVTAQSHSCSQRPMFGTHQFSDLSLQPPWPQLPIALPDSVIATTGYSLAHSDGSVAPIVSAVKPDGELLLFRGPVLQKDSPLAPWSRISDVGSAVAISDLNGDGALEVVSSAFSPAGDGDRITVRRVSTDGTASVLYRTDQIPGGVTALAVGDFDGQGAREFVGFARVPGQNNGELWVVR